MVPHVWSAIGVTAPPAHENSGHSNMSFILTGDGVVVTNGRRPYQGYGYAEGAVTAVAISAARFQTLMGRDAAFREPVFRGFAHREGELTDVIDALLLHRSEAGAVSGQATGHGGAHPAGHPAGIGHGARGGVADAPVV
ncbi:hypothetical protein BWR18_05085 [Tateyamaria omphalii]|uniref:Uncharacterized protein n=1 Tax=Tateyamaria omphalii TaxID=299262 RepID=A0A1P8MT24_9RHOB|nr:hypothetical protein BWR18_05085 [Tateyamaria omphalii]